MEISASCASKLPPFDHPKADLASRSQLYRSRAFGPRGTSPLASCAVVWYLPSARDTMNTATRCTPAGRECRRRVRVLVWQSVPPPTWLNRHGWVPHLCPRNVRTTAVATPYPSCTACHRGSYNSKRIPQDGRISPTWGDAGGLRVFCTRVHSNRYRGSRARPSAPPFQKEGYHRFAATATDALSGTLTGLLWTLREVGTPICSYRY